MPISWLQQKYLKKNLLEIVEIKKNHYSPFSLFQQTSMINK